MLEELSVLVEELDEDDDDESVLVLLDDRVLVELEESVDVLELELDDRELVDDDDELSSAAAALKVAIAVAS